MYRFNLCQGHIFYATRKFKLNNDSTHYGGVSNIVGKKECFKSGKNRRFALSNIRKTCEFRKCIQGDNRMANDMGFVLVEHRP